MLRFLLKKTLPYVLLTFVGLFSACASNRVSLVYSPLSNASYRMADKNLVVTTLADHRFRLYSFGANSMPDIVGWGEGTGTLSTPQNIPEHVSEALARQYQAFGAHAAYRPDVRCRVKKQSDESSLVTSSYPGTILCGSIMDYQFQIDHPAIGFGTSLSTFNMAAGADIKAQVALHLFLLKGNRVLWEGFVGSAEGSRNTKGPHLKQKAVAVLEHALRKTIEQTVKKISGGLAPF